MRHFRGLTLFALIAVPSVVLSAQASPADPAGSGGPHVPRAPASAKAKSEAKPASGKASMSFQEIWKVIEDSTRSYTVNEDASGTYADEVWPTAEAPEPALWVVKGPVGRRQLRPLEGLSKAAQARLDAAERAVKSRKFEEAAVEYGAVLKGRPDHYPTHLLLGDALLSQGKAAEALGRYEQAAQVAPWHHAPWFLQASALVQLGRFEEAADRYARALSLRPSLPTLLAAIESHGNQIGRRVHPPILNPTARAYAAGESLVVEADKDGPAWMSHALCKAMWLGEPELRKKRTGKAAHAFSVHEEAECLAILIAAHQGTREEYPDPALDRASQIAADGHLEELILYEIVSRVAPTSIPVLEEAQQARLHAFVKQYVLIPTATPAAAR